MDYQRSGLSLHSFTNKVSLPLSILQAYPIHSGAHSLLGHIPVVWLQDASCLQWQYLSQSAPHLNDSLQPEN